MKIGIDIRMLGRKRTGDETVFFNLVKNLALIDSENEYVLFLDERSEDEVSEIRRSLGIEAKTNFTCVTLPTMSKFVWNFWTLPKHLRKYPVDVYHTQYIVPFFVSRRIKIVTHIHDVSFAVYPQYIRFRDRFFLSLLIPRSLRRSDKIIAVSEFTKQEIVKHYGIREEKVAVVFNAISDDFMLSDDPSVDRRASIRQRYGLPEKFILYVGTLQPRKNLPALIRAFASVKDRLPDTALVIVGNRSGYHYDTNIDATIEEAGVQERVIFPGFISQEDLPVVMRMASVFVFPSLYEGFGLPVLEAMSQRVPVLASDIPPLREVGADGALFVDTGDLAEFSEILYTISTVAGVREECARVGIERVNLFSWRESARRLREVYASVS